MIKRLYARYLAWRNNYCLIHDLKYRLGSCDGCDVVQARNDSREAAIQKARKLWAESETDE